MALATSLEGKEFEKCEIFELIMLVWIYSIDDVLAMHPGVILQHRPSPCDGKG